MLTGMGVPARAADVVTSAQAAARLLADKLPPKAKVLVIGALALRLAVRGSAASRPVSTAAEDPQKRSSRATAPASATAGSSPSGGLAVQARARSFVGTERRPRPIPSARGTAPGNGSLLRW